MAKIPIKWPLKGLSDDLAFAEQPEGTTPECQNVRNIDPKTGRTRGGQRAGTSKFNPSMIDTGPVVDINRVTYDNRLLTYAEHTDGEEEEVWATQLPTPSAVRNVKTDRQGNVYANNGRSGIVKKNSEDELLWTIDLPVEDPSHIIRALFVDSLDFVYAAVSAGGDSTTSRMWMYEQLPDNEVAQVWQVDTDSRIEDIIVKGDLLYTAQNLASRSESKLVTYENIDAVPRIAWERKIAFPVNSFSISPTDGAIYTAHEYREERATGFRPFNPRAKGFYPTSVDWTPKDLPEWESRIWSWFDATTIHEAEPLIEEGDPVFIWRDISGNQRHLYSEPGLSQPPTYNERGIADMPSVAFNGVDQALASNKNPGTEYKYRDQNRTIIPGYTDSDADNKSAFTIFMVVRIAKSTKMGTILYQTNEGSGDNTRRAIIADRVESDSGNSGFTPGLISVFDAAASGFGAGGADNQPRARNYDAEETDCVLITYQCDGGVSQIDASSQTEDRSKWRINGEPIDRWGSDVNRSRGPTFLGRSDTGSGQGVLQGNWDYFEGDYAEIIVLDRQTLGEITPLVQTSDEFGDSPGGDDLPTGDQADNEVTQMEGYLMHKWGTFQQAPESGDNYPHPYGLDSASNAGPPPDGATGAAALLNRSEPMLAKYDSNGDLQWVASETAAGGSVNGGIGYGVIAAKDGIVYSLGPAPSVAVDSFVRIRRITDDGTSFTASGGDTWTDTFDANADVPDYTRPKLAVDKFDSLYVPYHNTTAVGGYVAALRVYEKDGTKAVEIALPGGTKDGNAVAVDPTVPDYDDDNILIAENVYLGTNNGAATNLHRFRLVKSTLSTGSPRTNQLVAVAGNAVIEFTSSTTTTPTNNTGRSTVINPTAQYIQSTQSFGEVFYTDGQFYTVYNPKDGEVRDYKSKSAGKVPERQKLIETWRGRIILARGVEDPYNWHMSEEGDPFGWDVFPPVQTSKQAVEGNTAGAGRRPDIINTLIPYTDDLLFIGGDQSIYMLTGNPTTGAELDLVSDVTGMSFGRPWCKDPNGVVYFFGSRGGVYRMIPGSPPQRITRDSIERRLQAINLGTHYIRMDYNYRDEGVHVFQCAFGTATIVDHWFFDLKQEAWFQDSFGATTLQPKSIFMSDGDDEDDRILLVGCSDGYVRRWDEDAKDDDGTRIDSHVTLLMNAAGTETEIRYTDFQAVLANDQDGCAYQFFAQDTAESVGEPKAQGQLTPGRNPFVKDRWRGANPFLRLRNSNLGQRWAWEEGSVRGYKAGRKRVRSRG